MATSIAFLFASVAIWLTFWALSAAGYELVPGQRVDDWLAQGAFTVAYALLAGFLVDTIRWLTSVAWQPRHTRAGQRLRRQHAADNRLAEQASRPGQ